MRNILFFCLKSFIKKKLKKIKNVVDKKMDYMIYSRTSPITTTVS
jgi:hypothetical protein